MRLEIDFEIKKREFEKSRSCFESSDLSDM